ncbi:hypothetical protein [Nonomuraea sediminis]|uniref:hypothetical protein n=1 Tax=Nonomuraea sediminis TaxID=2835864 RepID=UPI001BDCD0F1|nr:hypothetical protein [Nonomuraea sediminis]
MAISDDLWRQIDPKAGLLTGRQLAVRLGAVALVVVLGAAVWWSGLVKPRVTAEVDGFFTSGAMRRDDQFRPVGLEGLVDMRITNHGLVPFTITGVSAGIPGLRLVRVEQKFPVSLGSGDSVTLRMEFDVTDCPAVPLDPRPVRVTYTSWSRDGAFEAVETERMIRSGDPKRRLVAWQRSMADEACNDPYLW